MKNIPVITIDGPSGSGKGTVARALSKKLHWHLLDSGAIYRAFALELLRHGVDPRDQGALKKLLSEIKLELIEVTPGEKVKLLCNGLDVSVAIRSAACSAMASTISAYPFVREASMPYQRNMRRAPGLVADGRDMGTVVFPDAEHKYFLTASEDERAKRRQLQLAEQGIDEDFAIVKQAIHERDRRDLERDIAPAKPAEDAIIIDTTYLTVDEVLAEIDRTYIEF